MHQTRQTGEGDVSHVWMVHIIFQAKYSLMAPPGRRCHQTAFSLENNVLCAVAKAVNYPACLLPSVIVYTRCRWSAFFPVLGIFYFLFFILRLHKTWGNARPSVKRNPACRHFKECSHQAYEWKHWCRLCRLVIKVSMAEAVGPYNR